MFAVPGIKPETKQITQKNFLLLCRTWVPGCMYDCESGMQPSRLDEKSRP